MTKIILVRHGHVEGITPVRFRGRRDLPLTKLGRAEAAAVARRIASAWRPVQVYTSPLARCVATGAAIADACSVRAEALPTLSDIDYGALEFMSYQDVERSNPELFKTWLAAPHLVRFPTGESLQDVAARAADVLRLVTERHANQTIALVSHDSFNRTVLLLLLDMPLSSYWRLTQVPCCINEIDVAGRQVSVLRINETFHLDGVGLG